MLRNSEFVLLDINTIQRYLKINGEHHVRRCNKMIEHIKDIFTWTKNNRVPVISIIPEDTGEKRYKKFQDSQMKDIQEYVAANNTDLPIERFTHDQIIFHSRTIDPFEEPRIDRMLTELKTHRIVIMGISKSIILTVLGLLQRGKQVTILEDATRFPSLSIKEIKKAKRKLEAKGAKIIAVKEFIKMKRRPKWQKQNSQTRTTTPV